MLPIKFLSTFFSGLFLFIVSYAQAQDIRTDQVDKLFARWNTSDSPGAAVCIIKEGRIIYKKGYGMANLEKKVPVTARSVFRIGSMSKQFTAACTVILEQRGKLSFDDSITKYFPDFPSFYEPVTIRHMIHHISGVKDYFTLFYHLGKRDLDYFSLEDAVKLLKNQKSLYFPPGRQYVYTNSNYMLLGEIVRKVSGKSLRQFAEDNIFKPLGMNNTHFHDDASMFVKNRATGYRHFSDGIKIMESPLEIVGDGGIFTTVEDLFLWDQAFYNGKLGQDLIKTIITKGKLNNGSEITYAFGLFIDEYKGKKKISHAGTCVGHRADMIRFPDQKFTVICLTNRRRINPTDYCRRIADIYLN